jgi:molecular chaperone DnaJ
LFVREGNDIHYEAEVPVTTAVLGGKVNIPTLYGDVDLKIPAGTQPSDVLKVKDYGTYAVGNEDRRGDMYVTCEVQLPENLKKKERKLWQSLQELNS